MKEITVQNPLLALREVGQSVWLDYTHRKMLRSGELRRLSEEDGVAGETSNPAIEEMTAEGRNINITLLFSIDAYVRVAEAYQRALERRVAAGQPLDRIASVASFFVSRIDTEADKRLASRLQASTDPAEQE